MKGKQKQKTIQRVRKTLKNTWQVVGNYQTRILKNYDIYVKVDKVNRIQIRTVSRKLEISRKDKTKRY